MVAIEVGGEKTRLRYVVETKSQEMVKMGNALRKQKNGLALER